MKSSEILQRLSFAATVATHHTGSEASGKSLGNPNPAAFGRRYHWQSGLRDDASVFDTPDTQSRAGSSLESGTLETMASPFSLGSDAAPRDVTLQHSRDVLLYTHRHGGGLAPYTPIIVVSQPSGGQPRHSRLTQPQQGADIRSDDVTGRESDGQEAQQQK